MNMKATFATFLAVFIMIGASAQIKYSQVRLKPNSEAQKKFIFDNLELDHYTYEGNDMVVVLDEGELKLLQRSAIAYTVDIDDVVQHTLELNRNTNTQRTDNVSPFQVACNRVDQIITTPTAFGTGGSLRLGAAAGNDGYYTYAEMTAQMLALQTNYPTIVTRFALAPTTLNGNTIYGVKISDNVGTDENEPEVLYTALQHAREAIGGTSMIFFMQYLAENYASNSKVQQLLNNREIYIIPCLNPDGYIYNYTAPNPASGGGLHRKNRRNTGTEPRGVDINRNYGVDWGNCAGASTSCGSTDPTQDTYFGTAAFSERETQALRDFVYARDFVAAIDQHCTGPYYSLPYGRPTLHPPFSAPDTAFYTHIPAEMGLYNCHRSGNSPQTVNYEVAGGVKDWLLMGDLGLKEKIYGMTGEAGGGSFWAPIAQIKQLCKELTYQNLILATSAGDYFDIQDAGDVVLSATTGNLSYSLRRIGLGTGSATVSIIPLENIATVGTPDVISLPTFNDNVVDNISYTLHNGITSGQRVRFVWRVTAGGITTYDTVTKFYNPITLLYDNMEGTYGTNWTSTSNVAGAAGNWGFVLDTAYAGTRSMHESPTSAYTASTTRTSTYNSTFNLSDATAAYLTFWVRHRAENCRDKLQVQVSTDGTSWTALCGRNTVAEQNTTNGGTLGGNPALTGIRENWTRELFSLQNYIGAGMTNIRLRFQFTSDNDAGNFYKEKDQGFFIDEVKVIKSTSALLILPVEFVNFYGKLLPDGSAELEWEAVTDNDHDYFELQKSTDRQSFTTIARVNGLPPYKSIDKNLSFGNNYYRVRSVSKSGKETFSKVINIVYDPAVINLVLYPNPVQDKLKLRIQARRSERLNIEVADIQGKTMYRDNVNVTGAGDDISIDTRSWNAQVYILKIRNSNNEIIAIQRFIKQ